MAETAVSRGESVRRIAARLAACGVEAPEREARLIVAFAANLPMIDMIVDPDKPLGEAGAKADLLAARRAAREPLSRILGKREFWGLAFAVSPAVLDPRADTETLVEAALEEMETRRRENLRILDLGVGSGAIIAALLTELPFATGMGVDRSAEAAAVAEQNLAKLGLFERARVRVGDWSQGLEGPFDLIVSNPPYIPSDDINALAREVREHDPRLALDGGTDGLDAYRALAPQIARLLAPYGRFVLEHGEGQGGDVRRILRTAGLEPTGGRNDLGGIGRVVVGRNAAAH